jgi:hypothetical protein
MVNSYDKPAEMPDGFEGDYWIDEQIWGHRLYDEQTPWLTFLEFFTVFLSEPSLMTQENLRYRPQRQLRLRNVVFNNPFFTELVREPPLTDAVAWDKWLELMKGTVTPSTLAPLTDLKSKIPRFSDFARLVGYLRRTAIEGNSNKRWSSKFVFPFGPNSLYEDLRVSENGASNDRRFFSRNGELLYLMLARSNKADQVARELQRRFFAQSDPTDEIVGIVQGPAVPGDEKSAGYLPHKKLPEYDILADDWIFLLGQRLPKFDVLPYLVTMTGLHLLIYFLRRASATAGRSDTPVFVCEIVGPRRSAVRDVALSSFESNQALPRLAVEALVRSVAKEPLWANALTDPEPVNAAGQVLARHFNWPEEDELQDMNCGSPEQLLEELLSRALGRHKQHVGKIHGSWARAIGLSSRRGSQRVRYAPTDALLKALVFANVESRMEFKDFLNRLYERYGLVIGEQHAASYIAEDQADLEDFAENAMRLEERLTSLGLMHRLSDGCAYVELPFRGRSHHRE